VNRGDDILLTLIQKKASPPTLIRALKACWKLEQDTRLRIIEGLFKAGMPAVDEVHIALSKAVGEDEPDERLIKLLLESGASPFTNGCYALIQAVQGAKVSAVELILTCDFSEDNILAAFSSGFSDALFSTWFSANGLATAKMLLAKGAKGESVTRALVQVMKDSTEEMEGLADAFVELFSFARLQRVMLFGLKDCFLANQHRRPSHLHSSVFSILRDHLTRC